MAKKICILRWEGGQVPQALLDLENLPGNSTNPASYPFELYMIQVKGANMDTVLLNPSQKLLEDMIELCKELIEKEGIEGFTTSCGFNAIFQKQMADAIGIKQPSLNYKLRHGSFTFQDLTAVFGILEPSKDELTRLMGIRG